MPGALQQPEPGRGTLRRWLRPGAISALCLVAGLVLAGPGAAHVSRTGEGPVAGVPIAEITHGQMPVIATHAAAILALADRHPARTHDFQRVLNYARLQRAACLWGLVPGSVSDDSSPFNACSHAYLAASRDLLLRMTADPGTPAAKILAHEVDRDMMLSSTALEFCNYSAMPYDTATLVRPALADVAGHLPSGAMLGGLAVLMAAGAGLFIRWSGKGVAA